MGRTTTEIEVKNEQQKKIDDIIYYLKSQGYSLEEYEGYETWVRSCPPVLGAVSATYYCIQIQIVGDKWIIDEWIAEKLFHEQRVEGIAAIFLTYGASILYHKKFIEFIKSF